MWCTEVIATDKMAVQNCVYYIGDNDMYISMIYSRMNKFGHFWMFSLSAMVKKFEY